MLNFLEITRSGETQRSPISAFNFPAGERHVKVEDRRAFEPVQLAVMTPSPESLHEDLFQIAMWADALDDQHDRNGDLVKRVLIMPYVPGARADRGTPYGAKIYSDFISELELDHVAVFDPHSEVAEKLLAGAAPLTILNPVDVLPKHLPEGAYDAVIAPDKGALKRASDVADALGLLLVRGEKRRDFQTGKFFGYTLPQLDPDKKYLVVDDICDGGGTFMLLADSANVPYVNLHLYVSHGVFSKDAFQRLTARHYSKIITTNSFRGGFPAATQALNHHHTIDVTRPLIDALPEELRRPGKTVTLPAGTYHIPGVPFSGGNIVINPGSASPSSEDLSRRIGENLFNQLRGTL